jgi:outer membrane protein assembly factor BamB
VRIPRPPRRALWIGLGALALILVAASILGLGLVRGWFDSGSVEGTTEGFDPAEAPRGQSDAGSWPEFGFDARRTRANPALDLPPPFRRRWTYDAGSLLEFPPVLADGRAIVGTNAGLGVAIDLETGRELWRVELGGRVASSPAMAGNLVLFTTKRGGVLALDAATGRQVWRRALGSASESSPLVVAGSAYLGEVSGRVVRLDVRTGGVRWSAKASGDVKSSLAMSGPNVVVGDYAGRVTAFRSSDGRVVWRTTSPGERLRGPGRFYAGPAVAYGRIYLGNVNGRVIGLDEDTGEVAWVRVVGGFVYSSAAVSDRRVFVGSYDHHLRALDAVTGRVVWSVDMGERISGSPSVIGDLVYVSTLAREPSEGRTFALDAATGRRVLTFPDGRYSPAVAIRGLLVLTGVHTLYGLTPRR